MSGDEYDNFEDNIPQDDPCRQQVALLEQRIEELEGALKKTSLAFIHIRNYIGEVEPGVYEALAQQDRAQ